jgi:2-dehydropantoate 2-reductase
VAGALSRAGEDVTVVAREETAELINREGISVDSVVLGDFTAHPTAVSELRDPVDVLFVATKATTLEASLERVTAPPGLVVPLLNGLDHLGLLRQRFGAGAVAASVIRIESDRPAPGRIVQTSPSLRVDMASEHPTPACRLPAVAQALIGAGIAAEVREREADVMWAKLVRLNALAATTSVSGREIGFIRSDPQWRQTLVACIEEGAAAAVADGARIDASGPLAELDGAHPSLGSSMQRDLAAGRVPELDAIQGAVIRAAARHGLPCPTVTRLAGEIARMAGIDPPAAG